MSLQVSVTFKVILSITLTFEVAHAALPVEVEVE